MTTETSSASLEPFPEDPSATTAPATVRRHVLTAIVDLSVRGVRVVVPLPSGTQAAYVTASPGSGSWATAALYVRVGAPGGALPFAAAKSISAGGGVATVTIDDAPGLASIVVGLDPATSPESSGVCAVVTVSADVKA